LLLIFTLRLQLIKHHIYIGRDQSIKITTTWLGPIIMSVVF